MAASGHDDDRTLVAHPRPAGSAPQKRSPWMWAGLAGCGGVLCLAALGIGAALLLQRDREFRITETQEPSTAQVASGATIAGIGATETSEPTSQPTQAEVTREAPATQATLADSKQGTPSVTPRPTPTPASQPTPATSTPEAREPIIGPIVFAAGVDDNNQPIGPSTSFASETEEIHAVFDYEGMSSSVNLERRWYQDGEEVGSGSGIWDAGESGTFDLSLTGGGQPLGAGSWKLEIYINGKLAQSGTFAIESSPTPPSAPTEAGKIAFARWDGAKHNLYIANLDGSDERFLLESAAGPSWSPDGLYLSFFGEQGIATQVRDGVPYYRDDLTDGILIVNVANFPNDITQVDIGQKVREGSARWTAWAPNGAMIAFDATRGSPDRRIYFLGTADNQQYNIEIPGEQADWSPDSTQIAYRSGRNGTQGIWISNRDDSGAHNITSDGSDAFPDWSPDGQRIAFHRETAGNVDIYLMNADGSNVLRLTDAPGPDTLPAWTPDGRIVFRSAREGSWNIYIMNGDGSDQRRIIANADPGPDWSFGRMDVH
jgi:Tol biopolymer transport system component